MAGTLRSDAKANGVEFIFERPGGENENGDRGD